jgi:ATP/maltotriose-dependent transcriptional regulator MalT
VRVLDEAMLPVVAGRVRPAYAGNIYCQLMSVCHELSDLRRAQQWTDATTRWCEGFDSAVMFLGVCRVHRAQLLQVRGEWDRAEAEIRLVCDELASMNVIAVGMALYELGEVHRSRGDLASAEAAYAEAHRHGRDPQPGLARLRSAQGRHDEALEALHVAEAATPDRLARTRLWDAMVDVSLAAGDLATAERACRQLEEAAATFGSVGLVAAAAQARGRLHLERGRAAAALESLTMARTQWQDIGAPLAVAKVRQLLARTHELLGNARLAEIERAAVAETLRRLGVVGQTGGTDTAARVLPGGITPREADVLGLVALGLGNREVADALVLSEKTVARHLANLYRKLGVNSRTAAAAYAHNHGLVASPPA